MSSSVHLGDLRETDLCVAQAIDTLNDLEANGVTREVFTDYFNDFFVTRDSSGQTVELCDGGSSRAVNYDNRLEFSEAIERCRLLESSEQLAAIQRGIATIVPSGMLSLFTYRELELHIAGCPTLDLALLRSCTTYSSGTSEDDAHVQVP